MLNRFSTAQISLVLIILSGCGGGNVNLVDKRPTPPEAHPEQALTAPPSTDGPHLSAELITGLTANDYKVRIHWNAKENYNAGYTITRTSLGDPTLDQLNHIRSAPGAATEFIDQEFIHHGLLYEYQVTPNQGDNTQPLGTVQIYVPIDLRIVNTEKTEDREMPADLCNFPGCVWDWNESSKVIHAFDINRKDAFAITRFNRIFIAEDTHIRVRERPLVINCDELIVEGEKGALIEGLALQDVAPESEAGKPGASIFIKSRAARGNLRIMSQGQRGGPGKTGKSGSNGTIGQDGVDAVWKNYPSKPPFNLEDECVCISPPTSGENGQGGSAGNPGDSGAKGENGGDIYLTIVETSPELRITSRSIEGQGGSGGPGGAGGLGGDAGKAGLINPAQIPKQENCPKPKTYSISYNLGVVCVVGDLSVPAFYPKPLRGVAGVPGQRGAPGHDGPPGLPGVECIDIAGQRTGC